MSNRVYFVFPSTYLTVVGVKYPSVGTTACVSGVNTLDCGTVQDDYFTYDGSCGTSLTAASADYTAVSGDSGAPIFFPVGSTQARAMGIHIGGDRPEIFSRWADIATTLQVSIVL